MNRREFLASIGATAVAVALANVAPVAGKSISLKASTQEPDVPLRVGDMFTIEGRYAMNPVTRKLSPHLQQFCVTAIAGETVTVIPRSSTPIARNQPMPKRNKRAKTMK